MNSAIDSTSAKEGAVSCVDDRINGLAGNIA
jgi:hypothetical protein